MLYHNVQEKLKGLIDAILLYNEQQSREHNPKFVAITAASLNRINKFITNTTADKKLIRSCIDDCKNKINDQQYNLSMSDHLTYQKHAITGVTALTNKRWDKQTRDKVMTEIQNIFKQL